MLSMIAGDPGSGKSMLACDMAARVSTARLWPDGESCKLGEVWIFSDEDDKSRVIKPRLLAAGARREPHQMLNGAVGFDPGPEKFLQHLDRTPNCRLVILDPVYSYCGDLDLNKSGDGKKFMRMLAKIAADRHLAIVVLNHDRKAEASAVKRVMGSISLVGTMPSCLGSHPRAGGRNTQTVYADQEQPGR